MAHDFAFEGAPNTALPLRLVFNDSAAPSLDRQILGAGNFPRLHGAGASLVAAVTVAGAGQFPRLHGLGYIGDGKIIHGAGSFPRLHAVTGELHYNSDTQRPVVSRVRDSFQNGIDLETGIAQRMQDGLRMAVPTVGRYQKANPLQRPFAAGWQDGKRIRRSVRGQYQNGLRQRNGVDDGFQDAVKRRTRIADAWQQAIKLRNGFEGVFQQALLQRRAIGERYQQALPAGRWIVSRVQSGMPVSNGVRDRYQQAIRPGSGRWFRPPVVPTDPCYVPSTRLVFEELWGPAMRLAFICERHDGGPVEPGDTVIVPVRRIYTVINTATLRRVDGDVLIPTLSMSLTIDVDSWTWGFTARVPGAAFADLDPVDGQPVEVQATINGSPYRAIVEGISRERTFGSAFLTITGRGRAAVLDAPYAPTMQFGNTGAATVQQLANDVLTFNTVPLGWDIDTGWQPDNWSVPAGVFSHQGTYITALNAIAGAAGAYIQPHPTDMRLDFLKRYPAKPWEWSDVTPDFELPADVVQKEAVVWTDKPLYNRVYVRGMQAGVVGRATRDGTAGDVEAPMVTDQLITDVVGAAQRALPVLADVGRQAAVSLRMPVLAETGIIPPGKFVRYVDGGITRIGLVRSTAAEVVRAEKKLTIWQTIGVETHVNV